VNTSRRALARSLTAAAVAGGLALLNACSPKSNVNVTLALSPQRILVGETLTASVSVSNPLGVAVSFPSPSVEGNAMPLYVLTGPAFPTGRRISYLPLRNHDGPAEPISPPSQETLAPGGRFTTEVPLTECIDLTAPGSYSVFLELPVQGRMHVSPPVSFELLPTRYLTVTAARDTAIGEEKGLRLLWIAETPEGRRIGESRFYEKRPDLGLFLSRGSRTLAEVGRDASDPFAPETHYDWASDLNGCYGWREGDALCLARFDATPVQRFALNDGAAVMLHPAVMPTGGRPEVFLLGAGRQRIRWVRFAPEGREVGTIDIPFVVEQARVALGASAAGERRSLVLAGQDKGRLRLAVVTSEGDNLQLTPVDLPPLRVIPGAQPAIAWSGDTLQIVHFAANAEGPLESRRVAVTLTSSGQLDRLVEPTSVPLPVRTLNVTLTGRASEWVAALPDGTYVASQRAEPAPLRLTTPAAQPVVAVPGGSTTYLIQLDPKTGPTPVSVRGEAH